MKCINLCDLLNKNMFRSGIIEKLFLASNTEDIKRIYIGSYFCSQYFLKMDYLTELKDFLNKRPYPLTLVVPIISEKNLMSAKEQIHFLIDELPIDEITVNDVGMLSTLDSAYKMKLNLGRLFFKDARDIRIREYYEQQLQPAAFEYLDSYTLKYSINFVELDPISQVINLKTDSQVNIALHEPFCYMTTGNICKFASITKEISHKFRPNATCSCECQEMFELYAPNSEKYKLYRIGRAVYFEVECPNSVNGKFERFISFPFHHIVDLKKKVYEGEDISSA